MRRQLPERWALVLALIWPLGYLGFGSVLIATGDHFERLAGGLLIALGGLGAVGFVRRIRQLTHTERASLPE